MFPIEWIQERVLKNEYYYSGHAEQERQNDNLTLAEIEEAIQSGRILEQYRDTGRGKSCLVAGLRIPGSQYMLFAAKGASGW